MQSFESISSNIESVSYDPSTKALTVSFRSGGRYEYSEVDPGVFNAMAEQEKNGKSCSTLFQALVKGKHEYMRIS